MQPQSDVLLNLPTAQTDPGGHKVNLHERHRAATVFICEHVHMADVWVCVYVWAECLFAFTVNELIE